MSRCFPWIFCPWSVFLLHVRWVPHSSQLFSWRAKAILGLDVQFLVPQMDCFFDSPIVEYLKMSHFPKSDVPFCCVLDLDAPSQLRRDPFRHWPTGFKGKQRFKGLRPAFFSAVRKFVRLDSKSRTSPSLARFVDCPCMSLCSLRISLCFLAWYPLFFSRCVPCQPSGAYKPSG